MNDEFELLVLGGGPAGLSTARSYRAAGGAGTVAIVTDEHRMPYSRPPLTKDLLRGESSEDELPIEPEAWLQEHAVRLLSGRATILDADQHTVSLSGGRELHYRSCVLATGAEPTRLPVPGADHPAVRVVRTLDHVRELTARLADGDAVVVIGSGFIGCEIAASLRRRGQRVTLISDEQEPNAARLDLEAARRIHGWLEQEGVDVSLGTEVDEIAAVDGALEVRAGPARAKGKVVVMAAGELPAASSPRRPDSRLAGGAVPVDAAMRTEPSWLYAAGDVAFAHNASAGRRLRVEHWGTPSARARSRAGPSPARTRNRTQSRVLVDDWRPHAQVRGLGRRLRGLQVEQRRQRCVHRLVWPRRQDRRRTRARGRRGLTSAAARSSPKERRGAEQRRRRPGSQRGRPDRGVHTRVGRPDRAARAVRGDPRTRCLRRPHCGCRRASRVRTRAAALADRRPGTRCGRSPAGGHGSGRRSLTGARTRPRPGRVHGRGLPTRSGLARPAARARPRGRGRRGGIDRA